MTSGELLSEAFSYHLHLDGALCLFIYYGPTALDEEMLSRLFVVPYFVFGVPFTGKHFLFIFIL